MKQLLLLGVLFVLAFNVNAKEKEDEFLVVSTDIELTESEKQQATNELFETYGRLGPFLEAEAVLKIVKKPKHSIGLVGGSTVGLAVYEDGSFPVGLYGGVHYDYQLDDGRIVHMSLARGKFISEKHIANNVSGEDGMYNTFNIGVRKDKFGVGVKLFQSDQKDDPDGQDIVPMLYIERKL